MASDETDFSLMSHFSRAQSEFTVITVILTAAPGTSMVSADPPLLASEEENQLNENTAA